MQILAGFVNRTESNKYLNMSTQYFYLGFRTSLTNHYYDF